MPVVALDIGSTRVKAGVWQEDQGLEVVYAGAAPALRGEGSVREGDGTAWREAATNALEAAIETLSGPVRLGLATQRSSFLVWSVEDGKPVSPFYSWQDRQAESWCARHADLGPLLEASTGLRLSPHYFACKLAWLIEGNRELARGLRQGRLLAGTLDSFLLWQWSGGRVFLTDHTMAARTLLLELGAADWSEGLLRRFGVPGNALPTLCPSARIHRKIRDGLFLSALASDQAAGLVGSIGEASNAALINLGTGGFVLKPIGQHPKQVSGYLCGPWLSMDDKIQYALEGTMNGIGPAMDAYGTPPPAPKEEDTDGAFCLPDTSGVGAPHWRPDLPQLFSESAQRLSAAGQRRVLLEGILFRVREIVEDLGADGPDATLVLAGGLAQEPLLAEALATLVDAEVRLLDEKESTLAGIARLAAGRGDLPLPATSRVVPDPSLSSLRKRYAGWKEWLRHLLAVAEVKPE